MNGLILCKLSQKIEKVEQSCVQGRHTRIAGGDISPPIKSSKAHGRTLATGHHQTKDALDDDIKDSNASRSFSRMLPMWATPRPVIRGKRRRSGLSENKTPEKKARYDIPVAESSKASTCEDEWKNGLTKKRRRRRTKGLREMIKNKIEVALRTFPSPLNHLFTSRDDIGTPQAAFEEVVKAIGLNQEDFLKAISLSPRTVESISNITDMFCIERSGENKLMVKYRATEWSVEDCTVYLDNLPEGCTSEKICRIARKYGSVVQVHLPKSATRPIPSVYGTIEMGRRPKSFAFVQFTDPDACQKMCAAFSVNTPGEGMKQRSQPLVPLLQRLLMQIRTLSRRRRRRTCAQNILLIRLKRQQAAIIKKERSATKRSHKISRAVEQDKGYGNVEQENGTFKEVCLLDTELIENILLTARFHC
ncbi:hypothetical protein RB195_000991 [Necator americanus]|uniref:RRM domain-containing protein n=1 Tax=Necator americanus TaxID=51031 RepID=A0ABR1DDV3_NECAM